VLKVSFWKQKTRSSPDNKPACVLISDFLAFRSMKNKFLLFINYPISGIFCSSRNRLRWLISWQMANEYTIIKIMRKSTFVELTIQD
jgi:hypothetical protein